MNELKAFYMPRYAGAFTTHEVYLKSDADKVIAELKAREGVLVTDNRDLLEKVKNLENLLKETAEHYKRNEAQIIENADKVIAELQKLNRPLGQRITK